SLLERVIPRPTGENGYEDLLAAADLLESSELWKQAEALGGTPNSVPLAFQRRIVADPPVVSALARLKRGLSKPIEAPWKEPLGDKVPPEFPPFRSVGRFLGLVQYVQLADGRVMDSIETLRLGLRFCQAV